MVEGRLGRMHGIDDRGQRKPPHVPHRHQEQQDSELHLRQALSRLEPQERQAIVLYLDGKRPVRRAEKCSFQTALDKLRDYYLAVQYVPQANQ